ncbi:MAG: multidrug efflux RND transporter permease subunit [Bacteroidaceae bacterium]|nr:multidrug efflux RND transporter permease subunit [Bacteroidaceae bacterium]
MLSKFFVKHPIFATVLALVMVLAGGITLFTLPIAQYPDITPPTVQVTAIYPGADAETIAETVGVPIEQQVNGVDGMIYMSSTSSSTGQYTLTVTFEVGTDIDMATVLVQNRVSTAQNSLPQSVIEQGITTKKQSTSIVMFLALNSQEEVYDGLYLSNYANLKIIDELTRLPGVGGVTVFGADNYSMRVWLKPDIMQMRGVTAAEVYNAIASQNIVAPAGSVGQQPVSSPEAFQFTLKTEGMMTDVSQFSNIIIRSDGKGGYLRLKDVATIELGSASYNVSTNLNGREAAAIGIYQLPGSNALDVAQNVRNKMDELQQYFPEGVHYDVVLDTTEFVTASIEEVLITFIETTLIVMLVILLFLQNFRAVIIPSLTIPVSLIATFAVMQVLGFSINTLTLFGLVLAIAIVVDDAIVVVENATRLLDTGQYTRQEAVIKAMEEITGPVIGVVLVLLSVFIPTAFIGGITGVLYKQFALTIAVATIFSGLNSLTLTPALCALFLQPTRETKFCVYRWFNKGFDVTLAGYVSIITSMIKKPVAAMLVFVVLSMGAFYGFMKWPSSFIPAEDLGYVITSVQLPNASSFDRTTEVTERLQKIVMQYPEVENVLVINGFSTLFGSQSSNMGTFFVVLKPWHDRSGKEHSADAVVARINRDAAAIEEAIIFAINPPAIQGLGNTGGLEWQLEDVNNQGVVAIESALQTLKAGISDYPTLGSITSFFEGATPQYFIEFDRSRIELMGLDISNVFQALSFQMGASYVNDFIDFGRVYQVKMSAEAAARANIDDVLKLSVKNKDGQMVPFAAFTNIKSVMGQNLVTRYNMYPSASITTLPAAGASSAQAIEQTEQLVREQLGNNFALSWTGMAQQEKESGSAVTLIFVLAIILVVFVLAAQYESWTDPIAVILSMPTAILGTVLGCWIMSEPISIYTQIGVILLIALSAKNAILIVEFAREYRKEGMPIKESAIEAGRLRLRPILMTSFAFVIGVLPLLFASGAGAASRISLGAAVVFGMLINTILGTMFVPNFWVMMQSFQEKYLTGLFSEKKPQSKSDKE